MKVVVGAQWGDEGKGKIVDYLSEEADFIVRYQGGNNAGHTVIIGDDTFKLHLVPSGICRGKQSIMGNGVVINPVALKSEIEGLISRGVTVKGKLWLSNRAHLILEEHIAADVNQEAARAQKVGTTNKGIGPAYTSKIQRHGHQLGNWKKIPQLSDVEKQALNFLDPFIADTTHLLHEAHENNKKVLLEGAQGTFLDIDHGTYPFVTSSNCTSGGACTGTGLPPTAIKEVLGIIKAYTTRVGNGPFPTEMQNEMGDFLQQRGHEFGTTTGRVRRCGWLDLVMANYARRVNGMTSWCMTKLDVLSGLKNINICIAYQYGGGAIQSYPASADVLEAVTPVYKTFPGWEEPLTGVKHFRDLPKNAQSYLRFIEDFTKTPIGIISIGPERNQTIIC